MTATENVSAPLARPQRRLLGIVTSRLVIGLLLVWLIRTILINLSFVEGLRLPEVPFAVEAIITFVAYVIVLILLLGYAQSLQSLWPRAFPRLASLTPALTAIIYVLALSAAYSVLVPLITSLVNDAADFVLICVLSYWGSRLFCWVGPDG
jgi:hypothetical protein